ncbi:MAG: hypothetical protein AAF620_01025 [Bacteroidota bacterium]
MKAKDINELNLELHSIQNSLRKCQIIIDQNKEMSEFTEFKELSQKIDIEINELVYDKTDWKISDESQESGYEGSPILSVKKRKSSEGVNSEKLS